MKRNVNNPNCWLHCLDCGHRQMERRSVVGRHTRLRCSMCGGPLELSMEAHKDLVRGMDKRRIVCAQRSKELGTK